MPESLPRSSGVQLHITSLSEGRLGREAFRTVDWLAQAGQTWWQVLPLGPPDRHGSPYKSASAFACSPALLGSPRARVSAAEVADFRERQAYWVDGWAGFAGDGAVEDQVRFEREWTAVRSYAGERGVRLLGDLAIYVAPLSADHRAWPELFQAGGVAGAPPDAYSATGQLWGNPLYDWGAVRRDGFRWWIERTRRTLELFDLARIDHFRGLVAYWAVPAGARTALHGRWRRGPGRALFDAIAGGLGASAEALPLVAEDLGRITPPVERLRDELRLPGMLVLQFGFDPDDRRSPHHPDHHAVNRLVYSATHDTDTARGWYESLDPATRARVDEACSAAGADGDDPAWRLIRLALASPARVAMMQAQDILSLGSEARMNVPGRTGGSWHWRMPPGALTPNLAARLRDATEAAGRVPAPALTSPPCARSERLT